MTTHIRSRACDPAQDDANATDTTQRPQKGYLIAHIDMTDPQRYALYRDVDVDAFTRYGGRYIVRGGSQHPLVGELKTRTVVVEFATVQDALDCYTSVENQGAKAVRLAFSNADAIIVEGSADD